MTAERRGVWVFYALRRPLPAYVDEALRAVRLPAELQARFAAMRAVGSCRPERGGGAAGRAGIRQAGLGRLAAREPRADGRA